MAARISKEFGIEPELIKGSNGVFDVVADDKLIFSKNQVGRFPYEEEVLSHLRKLEY
jgi:selT/selW/selH-like putative selenoprotein